MPIFDWRCAVADRDPSGTPFFRTRGVLAVTSERPGIRITRILTLPRLPASGYEGGPEKGAPDATPGSVAVNAVVLEPSFGAGTPWESDESLVWCVVVAGCLRVVIDTDTGDEVVLAPSEVLVDQGGHATVQALGDQPTRLLIAQFMPDEEAKPPVHLNMNLGAHDESTMRRVVLATSHGRTQLLAAGEPPTSLARGGSAAIDVWQTGGPVARATQGGDAEDWTIEPVGRGAKLLSGRLPAAHDPGDGGWHTTATIDVGVVISGSVEMHIPEHEPIVLGPGDMGVHHATEHRWVVAPEAPLERVTFLFAIE